MKKYHYNIKLDIPLDADSARYFIPEGYTARIDDGVLIIEPKESEGERILNELLATFESMGNDYWHEIDCGDIIAYLKSLKNRGNSPKSNTNSLSWSEEDDAHLKWLCRIIHSRVVNKKLSLAEESELGNWMDKWLNHKPQSHWKPSEEQMDALSCAKRRIAIGGELYNILESLYKDLKKLM